MKRTAGGHAGGDRRAECGQGRRPSALTRKVHEAQEEAA